MDRERIRAVLHSSGSLLEAAATLGMDPGALQKACRGDLGAAWYYCGQRGAELRRAKTRARWALLHLQKCLSSADST